ADLASRRNPRNSRWIPWSILVVSTLGMTNLRVEKIWVVLATCVVSWLAWKLQERRGADKGVARRVLPALAVTAFLCVGVQLGRSAVFQDLGRWSPLETAIHFRVIFREMEAIYDKLPDDVRSILTRADAARYDHR